MKIRAVLMEENIHLELENNGPGMRAGLIATQRNDSLLVDLLPEPAAIGNVWENKLALVKGEGIGAIAATER